MLDSNLISNVISTSYHNILISDHSPISLVLDLNHKKQHFSWRLRPSLFSDSPFFEFISARILDFFETNDNLEVTDSTLWEAFKAVIRGHIISFENSRRKEKKRLLEIEKDLTQLETAYKSSANSVTLQNILKLRYEYNDMLSAQVQDQLFKLKQKQFELGDKPQKLLAQQLRGLQASRAIHEINSKSCDIITDPSNINKRFSEYYQQLYLSKAKGDTAAWLENLNLPKLNDEACEALNADITAQELLEDRKSTRLNSSHL